MMVKWSFADYRRSVEQLVATSTPFWAIEEVIQGADLGEDERAALWLLAWSLEQREPLVPTEPALALV